MARKGDLTPKQALFVANFLANGMNATNAYISAGYSENGAASGACILMSNIKVIDEIAKKTNKRLAKLEITADYVLQTIQATIERCSQAEQVIFCGEPVEGKYEFDAANVLKGSELLGRHLKLFTDKVEVTEFSLADRISKARQRTSK